VVPSAECLW